MGVRVTLCWATKKACGCIGIFVRLPPTRHSSLPLAWSTSRIVLAFRTEISRLPFASRNTEFTCAKSYALCAMYGLNASVSLMWSNACHSNSTSPVLMSISCTTVSSTAPSLGPPTERVSALIGL